MTDLKGSYDSWHAKRARAEEYGEESFRPWHRTVARRLPDLTGQRVLEIGCGRGDFAIWLAKKNPGAEIVGVDFSDKAIEVAQTRAQEAGMRLRFEVDNAEALKQVAGFDWVISCECMEHVPQPLAMAREIARMLKPGAQFILTTENYFNSMVLAWLVSWWRERAYDSGSGAQPHENFFLFWRVKKILERGGLKVEHMESNHFQWLLLPRVAPHRLCTYDFQSAFWKRAFRPFGRHFTFQGTKS
jgi:ubiquinone/menaquinone biosynthesis C-methylase UbiE